MLGWKKGETMIDKYLEGYCRKHKTDAETAKTHAIVKSVAEYYESVKDGKISVTKATSTQDAIVGECK